MDVGKAYHVEEIKVLLISEYEDDFVYAKIILAQVPQKENYNLAWVNAYDQAINAMLKRSYNVYLVDYRFNNNKGITLLNEAIQFGVTEPIIILTGYNDGDVDERAIHIGAADYLNKENFDFNTIYQTITHALKRNRTREILKESGNRFKVIFDRSQNPIIISDHSGRIYDINNAGLVFLGYTLNEIQNIKDTEIFYRSEDLHCFTQELQTKGVVTEFECQLITKSGHLHFCSLSSFLQIDTVNMAEVYYTIIHDLKNLKKAAHAEITDEVAHAFADQIRNPLSNINLLLHELTFNNNLQNDVDAQQTIKIIKQNCDRIDGLVENLIGFSHTQKIE